MNECFDTRSGRRLGALFGLAALAALSFGCAAGLGAGVPGSYTVYEMKSTSITLPFSPLNTDEYLAWLDNSRVVFEGYERQMYGGGNRSVKTAKSNRALFVWEIHTGRVVRHTRMPLKSSMCLVDGFISYVVDRGGELVFVSGSFGQEKEDPQARDVKAKRDFNRFTCKPYDRASLPPPRFGGGVYPLRPDDGWLERVRGGGWMIPKSGDPRLVTVPGLYEGSIYPHKFSDFAKAYLYFHSNRSKSETWAFTSAGDIEQLEFPDGPWGGGTVEQVRSGLILRSKRLGNRSNWDPGAAGLYLNQRGGSPAKIVSGNVYAMRVSPNGCVIAAFVDPWDKVDRKHRLIGIDLCKKG